MARMARVVAAGYPHHITQRGNRRQKTFFCIEDYQYYIKLLAKFSRQAGSEIWAYCLMPNHVHLVMVPETEDGLRAALSETHRRYTYHINRRENWRGHLWQERFHSFPMDENHLLSTVRYVENNPVKAGMCAKAQDWKWSSARAHFSTADDELVKVLPMLERVHDWAAYLSESDSKKEELLAKHTRTGRPLGSDHFIADVEKLCGVTLLRNKPGPKSK